MDQTLMIHDHVLPMIFHHLTFLALIHSNYCLCLCHDLMHLSIGLGFDLTDLGPLPDYNYLLLLQDV